MRLQHHHKQFAFKLLFVVGVGLVVAGAFVPVLLPVGIALISAAVAIKPSQNQPNPQPQPIEVRIEDNIVLSPRGRYPRSQLVQYHHEGLSHPPVDSPESQSIEDDEDSEERPELSQ